MTSVFAGFGLSHCSTALSVPLQDIVQETGSLTVVIVRNSDVNLCVISVLMMTITRIMGETEESGAMLRVKRSDQSKQPCATPS